MVDVWEEGTWKIGVTLEKTEYFVYKTVCAQYFRYKHPWSHILYSKHWNFLIV